MILRTKGKILNIEEYLVGKVTRNVESLDENAFLILDNNTNKLPSAKFLGILTTQLDYKLKNNEKVVYNIPSLEHLEDGDIVSVSPDGKINTLYRVNSYHNTILVTERCNSNCLMCSQPPKDRNDVEILYEINKKVINLIPKNCVELGISGGEPTLAGEYFFLLLEHIKEQLPNTEIHILTNGRSFAWYEFAERYANVATNRMMVGIPVYSDYYQLHDYIVQSKKAFYQTIIGLHNLARFNLRIEIRIVLHKLTIPRLAKLSNYIFKNLTFVEHVAFMGLEYIGYTPKNIDKLWIDPYNYRQELEESVLYLAEKGMHVSIYNTPLCVLPENLWKYARKSISDWKNEYLPECNRCIKKNDCAGFFVWNLKKHSEHIKPFTESINIQ